MKNDAKTLFIFEGGRAEDKYVKKLEQNFLGSGHAIKCVFDAEIYQLYKAIKQEDGFSLDIVSLLKERTVENTETLKEYTRDSFAYIYLFFDYEGHSTLANDDKIREMLSFFNDETDEGKLYISYPMVEAIRHFQNLESFKDLTVKCKRANCPYIGDCEDKDTCMKEPRYKNFSVTDSRPQMSNINSYNSDIWKELIFAHLCKANYLVYGTYGLPESLISQESIFNSQIEKYISHRCPQVAVLSAFPLYVLDYYGIEKYHQEIKSLIKGIIQYLIRDGIKKGTWHKVSLSGILKERNEFNKEYYPVYSVSVTAGVVNQIEYLGRSFAAKDTAHYHVVKLGDIVYTKSPTGNQPYGIVKQSHCKNPVAVSPLYGVYEPISFEVGNILHYYFLNPLNTNNYLLPLIQKGAKNTINISNQRFLENSIPFPINSAEILLVSKTLSSLNEKIELENSTLDTLIKQKRYLLNMLFI